MHIRIIRAQFRKIKAQTCQAHLRPWFPHVALGRCGHQGLAASQVPDFIAAKEVCKERATGGFHLQVVLFCPMLSYDVLWCPMFSTFSTLIVKMEAAASGGFEWHGSEDTQYTSMISMQKPLCIIWVDLSEDLYSVIYTTCTLSILNILKLDLDDLGRNRRIDRSLGRPPGFPGQLPALPGSRILQSGNLGALVPCVICFGEDGVLKTLHCGFKAHVSLGYNLELTWTKHFMKMYENRAFFFTCDFAAKNLYSWESFWLWLVWYECTSFRVFFSATILKALSQRLLVPEGFHPLPIDWHPLPSRIGRRT